MYLSLHYKELSHERELFAGDAPMMDVAISLVDCGYFLENLEFIWANEKRCEVKQGQKIVAIVKVLL
jgi:hypothetical protein